MLELRKYLDRHGRADFKNMFHTEEQRSVCRSSPLSISRGQRKDDDGSTSRAASALTGHRVLAIDLDPQASLSALHGIQPELDRNPSLYEALRYDEARKPISHVIRPTNFPGLDIVPANLDFKNTNMTLPSRLKQSSADGRLFFTRITDALKEVDQRYDVVVIDCPPQLGYLTLTALTASTSVLITIHPRCWT